jgi:LAO/AO transport system kinase
MKSGMMEVADIFAVNKTDRPGAETFIKNLKSMIMPNSATTAMIPVVKLVAVKQEGIEELFTTIEKKLQEPNENKRKSLLLAEKAWQLLQHKRMAAFRKQDLIEVIERKGKEADFNLYNFVEELLSENKD